MSLSAIASGRKEASKKWYQASSYDRVIVSEFEFNNVGLQEAGGSRE